MASEVDGYFCAARPEVAALVEARGARVLEVGCGAGFMGASLLARGATEVVGLELHPPAIAAARTRLSAVIGGDLEGDLPLPFPGGYFDCITFSDVLEHLRDPAALLARLLPFLAARGTIVVSLPNVRHESVVLPLLVDGLWNYTDAGILDTTHLRFYTLATMARLLDEAGLVTVRKPEAVRSEPSPYLARAAELVGALGGDVARFRDEATAIQYLLTARRKPDRPGPPRAADLPQPWAGAQAKRILLAPALDDPADQHASTLTAVIDRFAAPDATIGIALLPARLAPIPPSIERAAAAARASGDLVLFERPADDAAWQRLFAAASVFVPTRPEPALEALARSVGLAPLDHSQLTR